MKLDGDFGCFMFLSVAAVAAAVLMLAVLTPALLANICERGVLTHTLECRVPEKTP